MNTKHSNNFLLISGPMFSAKSQYLIKKYLHLLNKEKDLKKKSLVIKPKIDTRNNVLYSRSINKNIETINIQTLDEIKKYLNKNIKYIFIDEFQFFSEGSEIIILNLLSKNFKIFISCLDMDYKKKYFPLYEKLREITNTEIKLKSVCYKCNSIASFSKRITKNTNQIIAIESKETKYVATCSKCYKK